MPVSLADIHLSDPSFILGLCSIAVILVSAVYAAFRKASLDEARSLSETRKEERDVERTRANRLDAERHAMEVELAELRGKTDLTALSRQIDETSRAFADQLTLSFAQLNEEHRSLMSVMERESKLAEERHIANQKIITTLLERRREE